MTSCMGVLMLHITFSKYDCIIVHKAFYLFTCSCVSINSFHSHSHICKFTKKIFYRKFCTASKKRTFLLMKIPTEGPFRCAGHICTMQIC